MRKLSKISISLILADCLIKVLYPKVHQGSSTDSKKKMNLLFHRKYFMKFQKYQFMNYKPFCNESDETQGQFLRGD